MLVNTEKKVDPRVRRTRALMQNAFMQMLTERSFHEITVQDITDRATVNRATFYAHFEDKYALLDTCIQEEFARAVRNRLPDGSPYSLANLQILIEAVCEFAAHIYGSCVPSSREFEPAVEAQVKSQLSTMLLDWLAAMNNDTSTLELAATVTSWAIYGAARQWAHGGKQIPAGTFAKQVTPMIQATLNYSVVPAGA